MNPNQFYVHIPELMPNLLTAPPEPVPEPVKPQEKTGPDLEFFTTARRIPAEKPYQLLKGTAEDLKQLACNGCKLCVTGVTGWRRQGEVATICKCVRLNAQLQKEFFVALDKTAGEVMAGTHA